MIWYRENNDDNIMISTRIRLARNIDGYPFPNALSKDSMSEVRGKIIDAIESEKGEIGGFKTVNMSELDMLDRRVMMEQHLISAELTERPEASVLVSEDDEKSVMILEEDHIRIQVIKSGFKLKEAFDTAFSVDDAIEKHLPYAFSEKYGYLTSCPTNTGTGMRASVMMHLPALTMTGNIDRIMKSASNLGLEVRGLYGEGSKAYGSLYQLSNRITLGVSEAETLDKLESIAKQIKEREEEARNLIKDKNEVADRLWRSLGTLKYARSMSSQEAKSLISDYMLGVGMGIIDEKIKQSPIELMVLTEPANIVKIAGNTDMDSDMRDKKRAEVIRSSM